jgi:hypothetical protein
MQQEMGRRMKEKFDKYWGQWHENLEVQNENGKAKGKEKENINLLIFVAYVLDPRYKLSQYTELAIEELYGEGVGQKVWAAITKCLHDLFEEYRISNSQPSDEMQSQPSDEVQSQPCGEGVRKLKTRIAKKMKLSSGTISCSRGNRTELDRYLAEELEDDDKKLDILDWWKRQSTRFPILSLMARDVLAIPISTVASESAFSTSGRILDDFRSSLTPFMVEALICTQDWLRRSTVNVEENTEELTKLEEGKYLVDHLILVPFICYFCLFALQLMYCLYLQYLFKNSRTKPLLMHMLPSHKSKVAKRRWLHPPILAPSQSLPGQPNPQMKAKTKTLLNDCVS